MQVCGNYIVRLMNQRQKNMSSWTINEWRANVDATDDPKKDNEWSHSAVYEEWTEYLKHKEF